MTHHPDAESFYIDAIHALACYLIKPGVRFVMTKTDPDTCGFPNFVYMANGGASSKVSKIIKELVVSIQGLTAEHAIHSLRVWATDDMAFSKFIHFIDML